MEQPVSTDLELCKYLSLPGWDVFNHPKWTRIQTPSKDDAYKFVSRFGDSLSSWVEKFNRNVYVSFGNNLIKVPSMTNTESSILQLGQEPKLTVPLLRVIEEILSHPEQSLGLVRLADQAQIAVNGGSNGQYLFGAQPDHYSRLKRDQYWDLDDLAQFQVDWRQQLTANAIEWKQFRYRVRYPSPGKDLNGPNDTLMICDFRLIDDGLGNLYHLGRNVGMEAIS